MTHERGNVLICANGPSILRHPLAQANADIITTNRAWKLVEPRWHVAAEAGHAANDPAVYRRFHREGKLYTVAGGWPDDARGVNLKELGQGRKPVPFSFDLAKGVVLGADGVGTVALVALQVAVWLGYTRVWFAGLDLSGDTKFDGTPASPEMPRMNGLFKAAAPLLETRGIEVKVIGQTSRCTAFPRVPWPW